MRFQYNIITTRNNNAFSMTVLEERERDNPHIFFSKTGWYACGDISPLEKSPVKICRVQACTDKFGTPFLTQLLLLVKTEYENLKKLYEKSRWRNADLDSSKSDKEADSLLMHMKPSRFLVLQELRSCLTTESWQKSVLTISEKDQ